MVQQKGLRKNAENVGRGLLTSSPYVLIVSLIALKQVIAVHFLAGTVFGAWLSVSCFGGALLLTSWALMLPGQRQMHALIVADLLMSSIVVADVLHYRQFRELPSVASLVLASELWDVKTSLTAIVRWTDLLFLIPTPILLLVLPLTSTGSSKIVCRTSRVSAGLFGLLGGLLLLASVIGSWDTLANRQYLGHTWIARHLGMIAFHVIDASNHVQRRMAVRGDQGEVLAEVQSWYRESRSISLRESRRMGSIPTDSLPHQSMNLIVIQVESLQNFVIGLEVNGQEITPTMNRLSKRGVYFPNTLTQIARGGTADADFIMNCSLLPTDPDIVYVHHATNTFRCLPGILRERGYSATTAQPVPPDFYNFSNAYRQIGFEAFYDKWSFEPGLEIGFALADDSLLQQTAKRLNGQQAPYFAFITTMSSHTPFDGKNLPKLLKLGQYEGTVLGSYLHAVHYTDWSIGRFIDQLERSKVLKNTVVVLYGDHAGVHRGNSNIASLLTTGTDNEPYWQMIERTVPLIIIAPDENDVGKHPNVVGQWDIAPTLLELLHIDYRSYPFMGTSLLSEANRIVPLADGSAVSDDLLYLSERVMVPPGCFTRDLAQRTDSSACEPIRKSSARSLRVSRALIENDLIPKILPLPADAR